MDNPVVVLGRSSNVINAWPAQASLAADAMAKTTDPATQQLRRAVLNEAEMEGAAAGKILLVFILNCQAAKHRHHSVDVLISLRVHCRSRPESLRMVRHLSSRSMERHHLPALRLN